METKLGSAVLHDEPPSYSSSSAPQEFFSSSSSASAPDSSSPARSPKEQKDVGEFDAEGLHRVHQAVIGKKYKQLEELAKDEKYVNLPARNGYRWTPLHFAVYEADFKSVRLLVEHKANVNQIAVFGSPFHIACQNGDSAVVNFLAANDAKVDLLTAAEGFSPLMMAAERGNDAVVRKLLELKADTSVRAKAGEKEGLSALDLADRHAHTSTAALISAALNATSKTLPKDATVRPKQKDNRTFADAYTVKMPPLYNGIRTSVFVGLSLQ